MFYGPKYNFKDGRHSAKFEIETYSLNKIYKCDTCLYIVFGVTNANLSFKKGQMVICIIKTRFYTYFYLQHFFQNGRRFAIEIWTLQSLNKKYEGQKLGFRCKLQVLGIKKKEYYISITINTPKQLFFVVLFE